MCQLTSSIQECQNELGALRGIVQRQLWGFLQYREPGDPPPIDPPFPTFVSDDAGSRSSCTAHPTAGY